MQLDLLVTAQLPRQETDGPSTSSPERETALTPRQETDGPNTSSPERETALLPRQETDGPHTSSRVYGLDPGQRKGATVVHPDGQISTQDILDFFNSLQQGDVVASETTFNLYNPVERKVILDAVNSRVAQLWVVRPIFTSRFRKELWPDKNALESKSDAADAIAIRHGFLTKPHLFYRARDGRVALDRGELTKALVASRRDEYEGFDDYIEASIHAAVQFGLKYGLSNRGFDRLCGFNAHGFPSILRSNRNKHGAGKKPELRNDKMKKIRQRFRQAFSLAKRSMA